MERKQEEAGRRREKTLKVKPRDSQIQYETRIKNKATLKAFHYAKELPVSGNLFELD